MAIAAYLLCLWKQERIQTNSEKFIELVKHEFNLYLDYKVSLIWDVGMVFLYIF